MMSQEQNKARLFTKMSGIKAAVVAGALSLAIGGLATTHAVSQSNVFAHAKLFASEGGHIQQAGFGHRRQGRFGGFANLSEVEIEARATRIMKHVAIEIDATEEQQEKITALLVAMAKDLQPIRKTLQSTREEMKELLVSDQVDRAALEALRVERLAEADHLSKSLVNAMVDVAEVLTSEQRKILDERIEEFRSKRERKRRG